MESQCVKNAAIFSVTIERRGKKPSQGVLAIEKDELRLSKGKRDATIIPIKQVTSVSFDEDAVTIDLRKSYAIQLPDDCPNTELFSCLEEMFPAKAQRLTLEDLVPIKRRDYGLFVCDSKVTGKRYYVKQIRLTRETMASITDKLKAYKHYRLKGKNVIRRIEGHGDCIFVIYDYIESAPIQNFFPLSENQLRVLAVKLLLLFNEFHTRGLIITALQPENIFITADGDVFIDDFPCISTIKRCEKVVDLTLLRYIAPEYFNAQISLVSDWWLLGVLLYESWKGAPLFQASTAGNLETAIRSSSIPSMSNVSPELKGFYKKLITRKPMSRVGVQGIEEILELSFFSGHDVENLRYRPVIEKPCIVPLAPEGGIAFGTLGSEITNIHCFDWYRN